MSLWNWLTHEAEDVGHAIEDTVHDTIGTAASGLHAVGDALGSIDEGIESIPVVGTLYDFTPLHTAAHLGHEWANVGAELGDDITGEMDGRHADWGHLGRQALAAGVDTGIAAASSYIGGRAVGKVLGSVAGSAEKVGMRAVGRDVAGELGAGGSRSIGRRAADFAAYNTVGGVIGSSATAPARGIQYGAGLNFDDRPHNVGHRAMNYGGAVDSYHAGRTQAYQTGNEQSINHYVEPQLGHVEGFQQYRHS